MQPGTDKQGFNFMETMHALASRVSHQDVPQENIEESVQKKLVSRLPDETAPPKYGAGEYYAALYVKASIKGFLVRQRFHTALESEGFMQEVSEYGKHEDEEEDESDEPTNHAVSHHHREDRSLVQRRKSYVIKEGKSFTKSKRELLFKSVLSSPESCPGTRESRQAS